MAAGYVLGKDGDFLTRTYYLGDMKLKVEIADNFWRRFLGLMGRKNLPSGHGLLITSCNSVHMCFMRFPIDVVYLDKNNSVIKIVKNLPPWVGLSCCFGASSALELPAGAITGDLAAGAILKRVADE